MSGRVGNKAGCLGGRKGAWAGAERHGQPRCFWVQRYQGVSKKTTVLWRLGGKQESVLKKEQKVPGASASVRGGGSSFCQSSELWGSCLTPGAPGMWGATRRR